MICSNKRAANASRGATGTGRRCLPEALSLAGAAACIHLLPPNSTSWRFTAFSASVRLGSAMMAMILARMLDSPLFGLDILPSYAIMGSGLGERLHVGYADICCAAGRYGRESTRRAGNRASWVAGPARVLLCFAGQYEAVPIKYCRKPSACPTF